MFTITSVLGQEHYIIIPSALYEEWNLMGSEYLYASVQKGGLLLTKEKRINSATIEVISKEKTILPAEGFVCGMEFGFCLPDYLVSALNMKIGSEVLFILEDDKVAIRRSNVMHAFSPERSAVRLAEKLAREFEEAKANKYGIKYCSLLEDIYMFLHLSCWDDSTQEALLAKPAPLQDLFICLRDDTEFNDFLEKKLMELLKEYIAQ